MILSKGAIGQSRGRTILNAVNAYAGVDPLEATQFRLRKARMAAEMPLTFSFPQYSIGSTNAAKRG